jgi:hypothetical protein
MRRLLFLIAFIVLGSSSFAQITSNSPYSSFGVGEEGGLDHATISGIGNSLGTAIDSFTLNYYNPASYNSLSTGNPLFSMGISSKISNFSEGSLNSYSTVSAIQHFAFGFKVKRYFGMAFGLKPYSRRGYSFVNYTVFDEDSVKHRYSGAGGINELFLGLSSNLFKFKNTQLSVGGNFGYLFGSIQNQRTSTLVIDSIDLTGGVDLATIRAKSFHYDLGMYFTHRFNKSNEIMLTAIVDPAQKLNTTYTYGRFYAPDVNNTEAYDTLVYNEAVKGRIQSASRFTFGLRYTISRNANTDASIKLNSALTLHASYSMANYSKFSIPFDSGGLNYLNSTKYTFGLEYVPETHFIENKPSTKMYERMRYRVGAYYALLPYQTNGVQLTDFGTTFGIGLPIVVKNSLSSINFGFAIGQRGTGDQQLLSETYYGINFGVTISPIGDNWFIKRKLN